MKRFTLCAVVLFLAFAAQSQQHAVRAYANGDDSYVLFSGNTYKSEKKYLVIKFWNEKFPQSEAEQKAVSYLKTHLAKKNIEVVDFAWKTEAELREKLAKYGLKVTVNSDKHINIGSEHISINTTSGKALFVMEDGKAFSLCSGKDCEEKLKVYFKLKSTD